MAQLLIRNIPAEVVDRLKERAAASRRSLEAEARLILENAVDRTAAVERLAATADRMRAKLQGRPQTDSTDIIHEMRYGRDEPDTAIGDRMEANRCLRY